MSAGILLSGWLVDIVAVKILIYRGLGNFRWYPTTTTIKNTNIFQHRIIRMKLHFRYAEATNIKQHEKKNYQAKISRSTVCP